MFRFTIRDVLWLTVVVALAVGCWLAHARASLWKDRAEHLALFCEGAAGWKVTWQNGVRDADVESIANYHRATLVP
jgi:hypothetical protein